MKLRTKAKWTDAITPLETENKALSYQAATESIVLLENKNVLPIQVGKIALYGAGAGKTIKGGSGSGEVIERHSVSILEGLEDRGFEILTNDWLERYNELWAKEREVFIAGMRKKLRKINTEMLAEMMAAEYPQIRYIYQENAGDAAAKNHAAREAHGEYIVFNDSDDLFLPDTVERLYNALPG